jgi:deoxyadenosine/deoxycytidine kinase
MSGNDPTVLRGKLERFSHRLEARTREFEERGQFSDIHRRLMKEIGQRAEKLRARVDAAAREGGHWNLLKVEFVRDYNSLFDNFELFEERLQADAMRQNR